MSAAFATSQLIAATLRPGAPAWICCFASASAPGSRARIATSAPEAAYSWAIASPSPLLPPVTIALLPSNLISILNSSPEASPDTSPYAGEGRVGYVPAPSPAPALLCRDAVDVVHLLARQLPAGGADIGLDLLRRRRPGDDAGDRRPVQQPAEGQLQQGVAVRRAERVEALDHRPVRLGQIALGHSRRRREAGAGRRRRLPPVF